MGGYPPAVDTAPLYGSQTRVLRIHLDMGIPLSLAAHHETPPQNSLHGISASFMMVSQEKRVKERTGERNICDCSKHTSVDRVSSVSMEN